jgi:hypothetical protein
MKNNDYAALSQTNGLSIDKVIKNLFSLLAFKYEKPEVRYIRWDGGFEVVRHSIVRDHKF